MMSGECYGTTDWGKEITITRASLAITAGICILLGIDLFGILAERLAEGDIRNILLQLLFIVAVSFLLLGSIVYHLSRLGYLQRRQAEPAPSLDRLEALYERRAPSLTVLVPSYKENTRVIEKTLLSAALQNYPSKRVVLLIDNPPEPGVVNDRELLEQTRALAGRLKAMLDAPATHFRQAFNSFLQRQAQGALDTDAELKELARLHRDAARWLETLAGSFEITNNEDGWFVDNVLLVPAGRHREKSANFETLAGADGDAPCVRLLYREYHRLSRLFRAEITSFERKRYVNLSHEPNKAMNINSYMGLMGANVSERMSDSGLCLECVEGSGGGTYIPDAEFVITLDADSILLADYALTLVDVMQRPGNARLAVAQTPYSAFPGAASRIERIAGATTDIQYLVHQGFTKYNATFWVGANALLRKAALEDIVSVEHERGYEVRKYIQDRTVIEDTESSVDLVDRDWRLYNYPQRLAYSATPPDFGSLLIQRRRWANGGLIILPKFLRYITRRKDIPCRLLHGLLGGHYLTSLAAANLGIMVLLLWPFEQAMRTLWLPLAILPYFIVYGRDLVQTGYRASDVLRVCALSLLLVPVNLGGVFKSIQQLVTGRRTPFGRTPKVSDRTVTPLVYLAAVYGFATYCLVSLIADVQTARWMHAAFSAVNGGILCYAIHRFIGLRESWQDAGMAFARWRRQHLEAVPQEMMAQTSVLAHRPVADSGGQRASSYS